MIHPKYTGITVNGLFKPETDILFGHIISGAKSIYSSVSNELENTLELASKDFESTNIYNCLTTLKEYVINGRCPKGWNPDDLGECEYKVIYPIYYLFQVSIIHYSYYLKEYTEDEHLYISFVLSAVSRFRLDAKWLGDFLPYDLDDIDDIYFTRAEIADLISVDQRFLDKIINDDLPGWLDDITVLTKLIDENGSSYSDICKINNEDNISFAFTNPNVNQWISKFHRYFEPKDLELERPVLSNNLLLSNTNYGKHRYSTKNLAGPIYTHQNATCFLNLLAAQGLYKYSHK